MTPDMVEATSKVAPQPPKLDPETLVLRGRPPRVIRFRRGVIICLVGAGASLVLAALWFGLATIHRCSSRYMVQRPT